MCAINGFNFKEQTLIERMNKCTAHRGPDGNGVFSDTGVTLGHNRLSIIDLSHTAGQPMKNNAGTLVVTFNGEIYNFKELKEELKSSYRFKTNSDTEVILAAYEKWGRECVKRFNGMFAFAIWDDMKKELFLARDHAGVKPLYYFYDRNKFVFSSEIKGILADTTIERKINIEALNHYLRVLYVPAPLTMFTGIYKFPQASWGVLKNGELNIERYWRPDTDTIPALRMGNLQEETRRIMSGAVERQLVSDRPIGVYLSGGIDSSIVLHHVTEHKGKASTFSVGFDLSEQEEWEKFNKDAFLAKRTAEFYGANHHEVLVSPKDVIPAFERAVRHLDEPISNATVVPQIILGEFAKQHVDVVLGGDGGDELFGGYERYRLSLAADYWKRVPHFARSVFEKRSDRLRKLGTPAGVDYFMLFMFQKDDIVQKVIAPGHFREGASKEFFKEKFLNKEDYSDFVETFMRVDEQTWLVDESLMRSDKMSMASGLEQRVPFLDMEVMEFAHTIPLSYKTGLKKGKKILRNSYRGVLPNFLFEEPKRGWFSPGAKWIRHEEVKRAFEQYLSAEYHGGTKDLFLWDEVADILEKHQNKEKYNLTMLWALATFQIWAKSYNVRL